MTSKCAVCGDPSYAGIHAVRPSQGGHKFAPRCARCDAKPGRRLTTCQVCRNKVCGRCIITWGRGKTRSNLCFDCNALSREQLAARLASR